MKQDVVIVLALVAVLVGCKEGKAQEIVQTVEWFKEHPTERKAQLAKCNSNPGELAATPNCVNASRADSSSVWSKRGGIKAPAPLTFEKNDKK